MLHDKTGLYAARVRYVRAQAMAREEYRHHMRQLFWGMVGVIVAVLVVVVLLWD